MVKKGGWTKEEDQKLAKFINNHGLEGFNWETISRKAGLNRCGKSCRLRWKNYLCPHIKRGSFSEEEQAVILRLHSCLGNKWSQIAAQLPGRTDNDVKNFWNTKLRKKLLQERSTEYPSGPHQTPSDAGNLVANCLIMTTFLLGILNLPPADLAAQMLLLQQLDNRKQQEMVMASIPTVSSLPQNCAAISQPDALANEGNSTIPSQFYQNLGSESLFGDGYNLGYANAFNSDTEYCMPSAPVSGTDLDEIPMPMNSNDRDNPNPVTSFECKTMENESSYLSPDVDSGMHVREIMAPCGGLSLSIVNNASSLEMYD